MTKDIRKKLAGKTSKLAQDRPKQDDHPANLHDYQEGSFYHIDIKLILPDEAQPQKHFDPEGLAQLAQSIKEKGLYQPVLVRKDETGQIILVAGNRRLKAARMAGMKKIPSIFTRGNPLEVSLIENLQRENLKPLEEAETLVRMMQQHGYSQEELACAIGKAPSAIAEIIKLDSLPETIKAECGWNDKYPRVLLVEIAMQDTPEAMISFFNQIKEGNIKGDEVGNPGSKRSEIQEQSPTETPIDRDVYSNAFSPPAEMETTEQRRKNELIAELQNLIRIIDELTT